jgi:hypothetical protein
MFHNSSVLKLAFALGLIANPSVTVKDVDGVQQQPLRVEPGHLSALFFVSHDCPISNAYAREIGRICSAYGPKGVACSLVYVDPDLSDGQARVHTKEYAHSGYPKIVDRLHQLVKAAGVTITPEAAVVGANGAILYRGRIDDAFAILGQSRRPVTSPDVRNALDAALAGKPITRPETKAVGCYIPDLSVR